MKNKAFLLQHTYYIDENKTEESKIIGVYSSVELALSACERMKKYPGFRDHPNLVVCGSDPLPEDQEGFYISPYVIDMDYWEGGF